MKINASMTLLVNDDRVILEIHDRKSGTMFFEANITPTDFCAMLGRLANVRVKADVYSLDRVGLKQEMSELVGEMPEHDYTSRKKIAAREAARICPEGWTPDYNFGSQGSFFRKDGKEFFRTTLRRWVVSDDMPEFALDDEGEEEE